MILSSNPKSISSEEDSLNDFPSPNEYIDESKKDWQMPTYDNIFNGIDIKNQMPPLIEEIDFSQCKPNNILKSSKRKTSKKSIQSEDRKNSHPPNKIENPPKHLKSALESNDKKNQIESNLREGNFLRDIDSDNDQYDSYYSYYDDDYGNDPNNAVIHLPPPLEIGMEMPSVPEVDILDVFEFQLPLMPNPSDDDSKYINEIDLRFDREKLLNEVKSH